MLFRSPALFAEMFPAGVHLSGLSIGYALGSVIGGAFAPLIADMILGSTGHGWAIGVYIAAAEAQPSAVGLGRSS